jgi:heat shock protein HslJ
MTEMACEAALMDQDAWLANLLDGATIRLEGDTLTLAKPAAGLTLVDREVADPDRPLAGTRWVVDGLITGDAVSSVPGGVVAALTFSDGRVEVEAGCNRGGGAVTATEPTLTFGPIALTKMACDPVAMEVERLVSEVLSGDVRYAIEADTLTLDAGAAGLTLRAAP